MQHLDGGLIDVVALGLDAKLLRSLEHSPRAAAHVEQSLGPTAERVNRRPHVFTMNVAHHLCA